MLNPVAFTDVSINDPFWTPRIETNHNNTIPFAYKKCEETGRLSNFAIAGKLAEGEFKGLRYDDSDVFKLIEGTCYALALKPDPELEAQMEQVITWIAAAQQEDGYLYTIDSLNARHTDVQTGLTRWSDIAHGHELYNAGHLFEAAVAHYKLTGRRTLLDVAIRFADLIDSVFGPEEGKRFEAPGHQEIEIGLTKLAQVTGEERYLELAKFFLDARGQDEKRKLFGPYSQDHMPVVMQDEAVGHAVRAVYMYCGMVDVAGHTGDADYLKAVDRIWKNVVDKKLYLTGGIGARHDGEAFGENYELPNWTAYNETCAAIGNVMWNHRMAMLHRDAKYYDVLERTLYNGLISGVSLSGDRFFYPNPLESKGYYHRSEWFGTSCCPVNLCRFIPSLGGYIYTHDGRDVRLNLFVSGKSEFAIGKDKIVIEQETHYPWEGSVAIRMSAPASFAGALKIRVPDWCLGQMRASDLYRFGSEGGSFAVRVDGNAFDCEVDGEGYVTVPGPWDAPCEVVFEMSMAVRRVYASDKIEADRGLVALQRGPIVYCVEGVDADGFVNDLYLPCDTEITTEYREDLLGGVTVLKFTMQRVKADGKEEPAEVMAIPYYAWDHRESGVMNVWLAETPEATTQRKPETLASRSEARASHCCPTDTLAAMNDQLEPRESFDTLIPRMTFWPHKGTQEWVEYRLPTPAPLSAIDVFWFDDERSGGSCRLPASVTLLYMEDDHWRPVEVTEPMEIHAHRFNHLAFKPVLTKALRLEIQLREDYSTGILEWRMFE